MKSDSWSMPCLIQTESHYARQLAVEPVAISWQVVAHGLERKKQQSYPQNHMHLDHFASVLCFICSGEQSWLAVLVMHRMIG